MFYPIAVISKRAGKFRVKSAPKKTVDEEQCTLGNRPKDVWKMKDPYLILK